MIRIITNQIFGYHNGSYVEPKTKGSEPFSVSPEREAELVEMGIAEYATEPDENPVQSYEESAEAEAAEQLTELEIAEGFEVTREYLESLKMNDLKDFAEQLDISYKVGMKKVDLLEIVWSELEKAEAEATEPDSEEMPDLNPADAIV